MHTETTAT